MIDLIWCPRYHCTYIRENHIVVGEIVGKRPPFLVFSLIPGQRFDLLITRGQTKQDALQKFMDWKNSLLLPRGRPNIA